MSLSTYSDLKSKINGYLARSGLNSEISDAIAMFEARYNAGENNYFAEQVATLSTVAGQNLVSLPADFNEHVALSIVNQGNLPVVSLSSINEVASSTRSRPTAAALYPDNKLKLPSPADAVYSLELIYEAKLLPLSDSNTSNWMLRQYPYIYVYGALKFMTDYLQDDLRAEKVEANYKMFLSETDGKKASKKLGSTPQMRTQRNLP